MSLTPNFHYKNDFPKLLGKSDQAKYLLDYLDELNAQTCIVEKYIDKDYLIDFQKFYSRSFANYERFTDRFHFFEEKIDPVIFSQLLENGKIDKLQEKLKSYLGFVVKKPIKDFSGEPLIGRTLLKTYPEEDKSNNKRHFVAKETMVSLFGVPLKIKSVPFQMQDQRVSACATIALWTTLHALSSKFDIPKTSPAEITEISTSHVSGFRNFPQGGLTPEQMFKCIRAMNLEIEIIKFDPNDPDLIPCAIKAYLSACIPVIARLRLEHPNKPESGHAIVITGYKCDKDHKMIQFYVHDDGIGPYSRANPDKKFRVLDNEWKKHNYKVFLEELFVPLYPKIRLQFKWAYFYHLEKKKLIEQMKLKDYLTVELFLTTVQNYKEYLSKKKIGNKIDTLTSLFPKFLWVERVYYKDKNLMDWVFDGTATYPQEIEQSPIHYI